MDKNNKMACPFCKSPKMMIVCFLMMLLMFTLFYFLFFKNISFKIEKTSLGIQPAYAGEIPVKSTTKSANKVIVYYFHGNKRCVTCHKIEDYTKEAVQSIKNNKLKLRIVNVDEPANKHFVNDYGLYTKSVVVSNVRNGKQVKWKNLDKIWTLTGNKSAFEDYIKKEVESYL